MEGAHLDADPAPPQHLTRAHADADLDERSKVSRKALGRGFLLRREERARAGGGGSAETCWDLANCPAWEVAAVRRREDREFARANWERECAERNRVWAGVAPGARLAMLQEARRDPREFIEMNVKRGLPF